ncbi:MAG TPA: GntR family transcriptional regulator [Ramlibacter sp.]|nr:GntR family transcriptional regulator [Ramlibacter sp.]
MATTYNSFGEEEADVRVQKLSHVVADRLRSQIVNGQRKPGDKLPPETELLHQFKVSRPTIREALRILEVESLITMGRGTRSGATVLAPSPERAAQYSAMVLASSGTSVGELHEARLIIEPAVVLQLSRNHDRKLLERLQQLLDQGKAALASGGHAVTVRCTNEFHALLVQASSNRALSLILEILKGLSEQSVDVLAETSGDDGGALRSNLQKTLTAYQQLLDLMREGKDQDAQVFWRKYMERAQTYLQKTGLGERKIEHRS